MARANDGRAAISAMRNDRMFRSMDEIVGATELPRGAFATLVHPRASVSSRSSLGAGSSSISNGSVTG